MSEPVHRKLILGSTSPYRRELLARLRIPFEVAAPDVDETPLAGETPRQLACRLAMAKARVVAEQFPACVVIGSDQVAELDGQALGKPGNHARATTQLQQMRGKTVVFPHGSRRGLSGNNLCTDGSGFCQSEISRTHRL